MKNINPNRGQYLVDVVPNSSLHVVLVLLDLHLVPEEAEEAAVDTILDGLRGQR